MITRVFHPSGGLFYHLRALKRRDREWMPYRRAQGRILENLVPTARARSLDLILIGSSGAYTLETEFLAGFRSVTAVDWDPLAGFFLRRAHPSVKMDFRRFDFFRTLRARGGDLAATVRPSVGAEINAPSAPLYLFNNLLGQLHADESERVLNEVARALDGVANWISVHDRLSARAILHTRELPERERLLDERIAETFRVKANTSLDVESSGTLAFRPAGEIRYAYLPWALKEDLTQWVEVMSRLEF